MRDEPGIGTMEKHGDEIAISFASWRSHCATAVSAGVRRVSTVASKGEGQVLPRLACSRNVQDGGEFRSEVGSATLARRADLQDVVGGQATVGRTNQLWNQQFRMGSLRFLSNRAVTDKSEMRFDIRTVSRNGLEG